MKELFNHFGVDVEIPEFTRHSVEAGIPYVNPAVFDGLDVYKPSSCG